MENVFVKAIDWEGEREGERGWGEGSASADRFINFQFRIWIQIDEANVDCWMDECERTTHNTLNRQMNERQARN